MVEIFDRYARVSRVGSRAERLRSRDWQDRETLSAARARKLDAPEFFYDPDESGAKLERRGLLQIIDRIERGISAGIIVARLDRFSRDTRHTWELAERIHNAGGRIFSFAENADWMTADGELQVGIVVSFARYQRRVLAESFVKAKRGAVELGIPPTARMAPGLRLILDDRGKRTGVEHDERVADLIAEMFHMRARGAGPTRLGAFLEAHEVKTSMGSAAWSKPAIYGLLRNRAYLGELWNGEFVNRTAWAPIIDEATFLAAQRPVMKMPSPARARTSVDLLPGLARCWSCRYSLSATARSGRDHRWYRCMVHHAGGRCPAPGRLRADVLEEEVVEVFWSLVRQHHATATVHEDTSKIDALRETAERARRRLELYRDDPDLDETVDAMGGMAAWREGLRTHRDRAAAAELALGNALAEHRQPTIPDERQLRDDWPTMSRDAKRELLFALIDCVAVLPASSGLPPEDRVVVFAAGHGPTDLPRRGFRERATLRPFELPPGAGVLGLQP